jgi:hypothetical protein
MMQQWVGEQLTAEIASNRIDPSNTQQLEARSMQLCLLWQQQNAQPVPQPKEMPARTRARPRKIGEISTEDYGEDYEDPDDQDFEEYYEEEILEPPPPPKPVVDQWIECSDCNKWRKVTQATLDEYSADDSKWYCRFDSQLATLPNPCEQPEEPENPVPEPPKPVEFICKEILWEQWVLDNIGGQRQYRVVWTHGGKNTVQADPHDEQWPEVSRAWKEKCEAHGDTWPMPRPEVDLSEKAKAITRKYTGGVKRVTGIRAKPAPAKRRKAEQSDEDDYYYEEEEEEEEEEDEFY